ncbi:MAG TPA: hypothetical protein VGK94_02390 [Candidatus Polarisedimenticolia bacterium]|jgi:hypothetical protein
MSTTAGGEQNRRTPAPFGDRLGELSRRIEEWLNESRHKAESLRQIVEEARREPRVAAPDPALTEGGETLRALARFARDVEAGTDQAGILGALVSSASSLASRVILFVVRSESFTGWSARGFAPDFKPREISLPVATDNLLAQARNRCGSVHSTPASSEEDAALAQRLGGPPPRQMTAVPLWVRDRVAAVLYADSVGTGGPWSAEALGVMASLAGLGLEALPYRQKHPRPVSPEPEQPPMDEAVDPEETLLHEEARRFARLLVSEIVLYNGMSLEEGRRHKDIYQRLKDEIDRSHLMYGQRVSPRVLGTSDYFRQELVRVLAQGDESAIALPWV